MRAVITAVGAITSVGRSAAASCTAIRAGIVRPRKVMGFQVVDEETQESIPLTAHPIKGYTDGFHLVGRWMRLARGCVQDALEQPTAPRTSDRREWERTGLLAVLPYPDEEIFLAESEHIPGLMREDYLLPLHRSLRLPISPRHLELVARGHVGTASALQAGLRLLASSELERLLLVAVDSLLDPLILQQLSSHGRLKCDEQPAGLMPGEAGVCLLLETEAAAKRRGSRAQALVTQVALAREENPPFSGTPSTGRGLAKCIRQVLDDSTQPRQFEGDVYSDLNGEDWRAHEWGSVLVHLAGVWGAPRLHLPCSSVGDTGAASGSLGVCLATSALSREPARGSLSLVLSSSDQGDVSCIGLQTLKT